MLGLQDQRLEHRNRIEGRPPALRTVAVAKTLDQPSPEIFETRRRIENLERNAVRAQRVKLLRQSAKNSADPSNRPLMSFPGVYRGTVLRQRVALVMPPF